LAVLAAAPWGLVGARMGLSPLLRAVLLLPAVALIARQVDLDLDMRSDRGRAHDDGARTIARHLAPRLSDDARIWVWGWHLWDLYAFTGKRSATRVYKSLGTITGPNDDTWRLPASELHFVDGEYARMLIAEFEARPPAYVVLGSTAPHREFEALRVLLARDYVRDRGVRIGRVELWRHRGLGE
ncbi:MAG: hypothetical protein IAG13_04220, partial [Deltaproteobacteria bacterium]|nr:hypothetical protein [Nannocystaceae bacterium]